MYYIIFDLEFNQEPSSPIGEKRTKCPFEIIQIGAVKLDADYRAVSTFHRLIKPTIYSRVNEIITALTGITTEQLSKEETFPAVYQDFARFIGGRDCIFCTWGTSDMRELYQTIDYYALDKALIPNQYINLQPLASSFLKSPQNKLLKLQTAVEAFQMEAAYPFHNALYDAFYTAKIMKKLNHISFVPEQYPPHPITVRHKRNKKVVDYDGLIKQFQKMYAKDLTHEEQEIIKLAYKMGKTGQFIKKIQEEPDV